jgi:dTDP-4-dehydrorhamnose reductase
MANPKIVVTGANGQLGKEIKVASQNYPAFDFIFVSREELPVDNPEIINQFFEKNQPSFCINCAAYTAVDKAETDKQTAYAVNAEAVAALAFACKTFHTKLVHISTDYVFDGTSSIPLTEDDLTNPINIYGASKLEGEKLAFEKNRDAIVIRTSWVYSEFGNNFVKTMMRLMNERKEINVVADQFGAPTYAASLADAILVIINNAQTSIANWKPGIYHYSNTGKISWFDFAVAIKKLINSECTINPVPTEKYPTPAKRPSFSLLDTKKIQQTFHINIPAWEDGLQKCLSRLQASV